VAHLKEATSGNLTHVLLHGELIIDQNATVMHAQQPDTTD